MEITKFLLKIISINSENPPGRENRLAEFIAKFLKSKGFKIIEQKISNERKNIIACSGKPQEAFLIFNSHLDTVPIGDSKSWQYNPLGEIKDGKIYGCGACDVKGSVSALIVAAIKAKKEGHKNFALLFTADEESGNFLGAKKFAKNMRRYFPNLKLLIVTEPTNLRIGIAHKGVIYMKLKFKGKEAHGSTPNRGKNAIFSSLKAIAEILDYQNSRSSIRSQLLGNPTLNIGRINGGTKVNIVPNYCQVELETRVLPNECSDQIIKKIRSITKSHGGSTEIVCSFPAFFQENNNLVKKIEEVRKKLNFDSKFIGLNYYTEAEIYKRETGIDCLILGVGNQEQMHCVDEFIEIKDLRLAEKIYFDIIRNFNI